MPRTERVPIVTHANRRFVAQALDSWRYSAEATYKLLQENFGRMQQAKDDEKAFLGWEIVSAAVELGEIAATVIRYARDSTTSLFHSADNATLKVFFAAIRDEGMPPTEARDFLRLRVVSGLGKAAVRVLPVYAKLIAALQAAVRHIAEFWLLHAENARWFRHLPMSFTLDEVYMIAPEARPAPKPTELRLQGEMLPLWKRYREIARSSLK